MPRKKVHPKRGGARPGSGRKSNALRKTRHICLTDQEFSAVMELIGTMRDAESWQDATDKDSVSESNW